MLASVVVLLLARLHPGSPLARPGSSPLLCGPAVVVLLQDGCPCAKECHVALNALAASCRGKVRFEELVDGDAERARDLARSAELHFPVVPDPRKAEIRRTPPAWARARCRAQPNDIFAVSRSKP